MNQAQLFDQDVDALRDDGEKQPERRQLVNVGDVFGMLTVLKKGPRKRRKRMWLCLCECGNLTEKNTACVMGNKSGCGCILPQVRVQASTKHGAKVGGKETPTYRSWHNMKARCFTPTDPYYSIYGAAGITVCDRWKDSFENFLADMGERPKGKTLDRIDNSRNYEPGNCRWATIKEQNRNRTDNFYITLNGETKCLSEWCEIYGMDQNRAQQRIRRQGWEPLKALTKPIETKHGRRKKGVEA